TVEPSTPGDRDREPTVILTQDPPQASKRPKAEPAPETRTATAAPLRHSEGPAREPQPWRKAVTGFATDFAAPADNHSEWVERMRQWVPRFLADQYVHMDPARRPVAQLIG